MDAEHARFVFANAPGWLTYLFALAALAVGVIAWRRYGPAPAGLAGGLARACRVAALVAVIALLAGPTLRTTIVTSEPGSLVVAVDRSASMARADGRGDAPRIASAGGLATALAALGDERELRVDWYTIGDGVAPLEPSSIADLAATAGRSALGEDLMQLVYQTRPDAVLVVSDGRVTGGSQLDAVGTRLAELGLPEYGVWALATGGTSVEPSLALDELSLPRQVPLGERVPTRVRLTARNLDTATPLRLTVRRDDETVIEREVAAPAPEDPDDPLALATEEIAFDLVFPDEGEHDVAVTVEKGAYSATLERRVSASQRKLQVLLLAHRPRYEMRYLRVALDRDLTVTVHSYLTDGRWRRWGDQTFGPERKPLSRGALADYDAIVLGDIGAEAFRAEQLDALADHVRDRGAGLIWIPGARGAITSFRGTRLGNLLPVRLADAGAVGRGYRDNLEAELLATETAESLRLLTLEDTTWRALPLLRSTAPVIDVLAGANVLAIDARTGTPLVVGRSYDAGRALFVGTDDTWRWRRNVGDRYLHRFYSQLLRHVSAGRGQGEARWRVAVAPHTTTPGTPVQLGVVPNGAGGDDVSLPDSITVRLDHAGEQAVHRLHRGTGGRSYLAEIPAPAPGTWRIDVADGLAASAVIDGELLVQAPRDELRDPRRDAAALRALTEATGGKLVLGNEADDADPAAALLDDLPALGRQRATTTATALWDEWWILLLLAGLLSLEWALRRWHRLP